MKGGTACWSSYYRKALLAVGGNDTCQLFPYEIGGDHDGD